MSETSETKTVSSDGKPPSQSPPPPATAMQDPVLVKVSRKAVPTSLKYEEYIAVYQQLLRWIATIKLTEEEGAVRQSEIAFLGDHAKLQKYLKVSHGRLAGAQRRVIQAMERIRRLKGEAYISPESPSARSAFEVHLKSADIESMSVTPKVEVQDPSLTDPNQLHFTGSAPQKPLLNPYKGFSVQMDSITAPVALPLSAGIEVDANGKLSVKIEFGSPTTSVPSTTAARPVSSGESPPDKPLTVMDVDTKDGVDEQRGIATLLAMRRNKNGDAPAVLPAPLLSESLKSSPARGVALTATSPRRYTSHAYYRSDRVKNGAVHKAPSSAVASLPPVSSGLPRAMHELHLRRDGNRVDSPMLDSGARSSPRVYIPPPPRTASSGRPIRHIRTASDSGPSARQMHLIPPATPSRRFIPPPMGSARIPPASPARRYIHPPASSPRLQRSSLPRSPPRYHPYAERDELPSPSPLKESFLRRAMDRSPSPSTSGQDALYQPCGTVHTRRRRSNERLPSTLAAPYVRPAVGGRSISDQPVWHQAQHSRATSNGSDFSTSRKRAYEEINEREHQYYKRNRSDSGSDGESASSGGLSASRRFIPPPQIMQARSAMAAAGPSIRQPPRPITPPRQATPPDVKPQVSASNPTADLLSALLEEVKGAGKKNGGEIETAKALENVATTLAQVAQKLRRAK